MRLRQQDPAHVRYLVCGFLLGLGVAVPALGNPELSLDQTASPVTKPWEVAVTVSLHETPVSQESADHYRAYSLGLETSYQIATIQNAWLKDPAVSVAISYSDELIYEDQETNFDNTVVTLMGLSHSLSEPATVTMPVSAVLATDEDERDFYGYRGSLVLSPTFTYKPQKGWSRGLSLGLGGELNQSFYDYETNRRGFYNAKQATSWGPRVGYELGQASLAAALTNTSTLLYDGTREEDSYSVSVKASYSPTEQASFSLSWSQRDRTFGYDGVTPNVNFRFADLTVVTASGSYSM